MLRREVGLVLQNHFPLLDPFVAKLFLAVEKKDDGPLCYDAKGIESVTHRLKNALNPIAVWRAMVNDDHFIEILALGI
jgi:hypothetical protein